MKRYLTILLLLTSLSTFGAAVNFTAKISHQVVEVGQRFQVTFTVNSRGGNFTPPDFHNFRLLGGPNQSQSMQYVNGKMSHSTSLSYILAATESGEYTIDQASIVVEGETYKTKPLKIKVVKASDNSAQAQRKRQQDRKSKGDQLSDYVYIKAFVDKNEVYVGEKITATFKLYSKLGINNINLEKLPALNGFWSHNLQSIYDQIRLSREVIDGEVYNVAELQQSVLYPQRAGELQIDPLEMKVMVNVRSRRSRSIYEQMFGSYERKELIVNSSPIKIKVTPLPVAGRPADFSGAVGDFNMKLSTNKNQLKTNDAIDFKITISGSGNLPLIGAPKLHFPPDFEVYDPETTNNYQTNYNGASGSKTFEYLVIPRHPGEYEIEPYTFSYFDVKTKSYKRIQSDPIKIIVEKGTAEEQAVYSAKRKEEIQRLNTDIRYIQLSDLTLYTAGETFYGSGTFYLSILFLLLIIVLLWLIAKKRKEQLKDKVGLRKSKAKKLAKKRLSKAKKHLDADEKRLFYEAVSDAIYGYFADKFNIALADLSQEEILNLLSQSHADEELQNLLKRVLEEAEMARFAQSSAVNAQHLYENAMEIISQSENLKT